jgi:hypothetical protein
LRPTVGETERIEKLTAVASVPAVPTSGRFDRLGRLQTWIDPEWFLFVGTLLLPSLFCLMLADRGRAVFFARLALHLGTLKWLGWTVLTRPSSRERRDLVFPAELVVGLALAVAWFYVRNVLSIVPRSYSLMELRLLAWLIAIFQLTGIAMARSPRATSDAVTRRTHRRALLYRTGLYAVFTLTLSVTLWSVAHEVFVPSQDGWFHSFIARVYLEDGLFYRHFNGGSTIFYPSGFGAINATTAAISGLTVVQAQNLQHILLTVVGLYLVTTLTALLANRSLMPVHFVPPVFLSLYPVHNLPPDVFSTHTPQQAASPLLIAIPLLSLLLPVTRRRALYVGVAVQAFLSMLVAALNPTCAIFLPLAFPAALVLTSYRARNARGEGVLTVASIYAGLALAAAVLVLGADRYYSTLLLDPSHGSYMSGSDYGGDTSSKQPRRFSWAVNKGVAALATTQPMKLLADWPGDEPDEIPWRRLPLVAVALSAMALGLAVRRVSEATRTLASLAVGFVVCSTLLKYMVSFLLSAISNPDPDVQLLRTYLQYLPPRLELWLLFTAIITGAVSVHVSARTRSDRLLARTLLGTILVTLVVWWLPYVRLRFDPRRNQLVARNVGFSGRITTDDIGLVSWIERNTDPGQGPIGLASVPFKIGNTKVLLPIGSSQALSLYGKGYNFTFQLFDPSRRYSFDDYTAHVVNYFDANWCLNNNVRFFYLPNDVYPNHGLKRAREVGLLLPVRTVSSSGLYAVMPLSWTPVLLSIPATPATSNQVNWQPDGSGVMTGIDPQVVYALDTPRFVHAVRFKYKFDNAAHAAAAAQFFWKRRGQEFVENERMASLRLEPGSNEETLTILVHDTLDQFRFDPDAKAGTFRIRDVELLVKPLDDRR